MSTIKNGQIWLYCHFNKIIKGTGTSFQSPAFSQKHVTNVCHTPHQYLTKQDLRFKRKKHKCNLHYAAMLMMTSQILKSAGFTKTQKSRYLENEALFFLQIKKFINYTSGATLWQKLVLQETFNIVSLISFRNHTVTQFFITHLTNSIYLSMNNLCYECSQDAQGAQTKIK